jgi:phosphotransferase system HPr (HPr) family protein
MTRSWLPIRDKPLFVTKFVFLAKRSHFLHYPNVKFFVPVGFREANMSYQASVEVLDPIGLHARPAGQIVKFVKDLGLDVKIGPEAGDQISASSALRMMAMKAKTGDRLLVTVEGVDDARGAQIVAEIQEFLKG